MSMIELESRLRYIVIPVICGSSGMVFNNVSSCDLKESTEHFVMFLIRFGRELNNITAFTENELSLAFRILGNELSTFFRTRQVRPCLSLFIWWTSPFVLRFGTSPSRIFQRYIIRYLSLRRSSEYRPYFLSVSQ